ncbi:MAG: hypothetical protein KBD67_06240 [Anaerolineaceae bacterium]|nr:hypothetical protein [Anaerolineaceae bacterium]
MQSPEKFEILLLLARPAAGKSEIIDFLKQTTLAEREKRFHVGKLLEIDDFPMLWTWFEEDELLQQMGHPRLHSDAEGYFLGKHLWNLLIERICLEYQKRQRDIPRLSEDYTTLIEFSRGSEHGGYQSAFRHLSPLVLERMAVIYVDVSWEESLRKNRKRFNPDKPDSILEHGLADDKLERLYRENDWQTVSSADKEYLNIQGVRVPYAVFDNSDDVTSARGEKLGARLEEVTSLLWLRYQRCRS